MCGQEAENLTKAKIEGSKLSVCSTCAEMGSTLESDSKQKDSKTDSGGRRGSSEELAPDYGAKVREAREGEQLSISELSDDLNEKSSLISKIEREELKPDRPLGKKLERRFDIDLYVNPETVVTGKQDTDDRKATIGDVAD